MSYLSIISHILLEFACLMLNPSKISCFGVKIFTNLREFVLILQDLPSESKVILHNITEICSTWANPLCVAANPRAFPVITGKSYVNPAYLCTNLL